VRSKGAALAPSLDEQNIGGLLKEIDVAAAGPAVFRLPPTLSTTSSKVPESFSKSESDFVK